MVKVIARNKRTVTLNFSADEGRELLCALLREADVFIENFRPGVLEAWGLGPDVMHDINHVSSFCGSPDLGRPARMRSGGPSELS